MFFDNVPEGPPDAIFGMLGAFEADPRAKKVNLMVGTFKDDNLRSELLQVVRQAKEKTLTADGLADYLPFEGLPEFCQLVGGLVFGKKNWEERHGEIYAAQSVGGTGALRVGAEFLAQEVGKTVYLPQPTWANHRNIFERGRFNVEPLPYYNQKIHKFDADAFLDALRKAEPKSVIVLHATCHNPTGSDPTFEEWQKISDICKEKSLVPFFDLAYQGLGDGIEEDAKAVRLFLERGHEMLVAYSCSKNFSLYCQRVGALFAVCSNPAIKTRVGSQIKRIIRAMYSNPPAHGARIVAKILKDPDYLSEWHKQVGKMRHRISVARQSLIQRLLAKSKKTDFSFLKHHRGMFSYLDLTKSQVQELIEKYGIYTLDSGRINVAGLTYINIDFFVDSVIAVCEK